MSTAPAPVAPVTPTLDTDPARHAVPLLVDAQLQARIARTGYATLDPVLTADDLARLRDLADEFLRRVDGPTDELFLTVGRIGDTRLRAEMIERAGAIVRPRLEPLFVDDAQYLCSAFQVKPSSPSSALDPHQDSSLVDETRWPGIYAWIPLVDTETDNGGLQVVPGSHLLGNRHRTLNVPWQFDGLTEVLRAHSVPLGVPAGAVVLFDSATVHGSPPNHSGRTRVALNNFVRPRGAGLRHIYQDDTTPDGLVEVFEIDQSFLFSDDIMARPGPHHRSLGLHPHHRLRCTAEQLDDLCRQAARWAGATDP